MSEYLTYILWRQREETLPRELELERQRVIDERLTQQSLPSEKQVPRKHPRRENVRQKPARASDATAASETFPDDRGRRGPTRRPGSYLSGPRCPQQSRQIHCTNRSVTANLTYYDMLGET